MIRITVVNARKGRRAPRKALKDASRLVLRGEKMRDANVSIICVGHRLCRAINRKYLRHDRTTDVISFPMEERPVLEGEIYINIDQAALQADTYRVTTTNEMARLAIHGTLHLLGYDDRTIGDRKVMKQREEAYLARCERMHTP